MDQGRRLLAAALAAASCLAAPGAVTQAADTAIDARGGAGPGPDMRILPTPEDVHFRVRLGETAARFQPQEIEGAAGWTVSLAPPAGRAQTIWPTPATDGERVFAGGPLTSHEFFAVRADTGRLAWKTRLSDNGPTPAVVRDRRVYFNTQSCTVYAYDARTGNRVWSRYLAGHLESIPALGDGVLLSTRPTRHESRDLAGVPALTTLNLSRGAIVSDVTLDGEAVGAPVVHAGRAYVATRAGTLACIDVDAGEEVWRRSCRARSAPWVDASGVYVAGDSVVQGYHLETGAPRWTEAAITPSSRAPAGVPSPSRALPPPLRREVSDAQRSDAFWGEGLRPVVTGDLVCVAEGGTVRLFDRTTGAERAWWELDLEGPLSGSPILAGATLVLAGRSGQVRAVDLRHGEVVWAVDLVDAELGSGVVLHAGRLYAATTTGRLVCVETGDLRADGWPMWSGTASHTAPGTR